MARLELRGDLNQVAARMVADRVGKIASRVREEATHTAPAAKTWLSEQDQRVRPSHQHAHGQTIPENLHYQLRKMIYERRGRGPGGKALNPAGGWKEIDGYDLADKPRDPALPREQRVRCRCQSVIVPGAIARRIHAGPAVVAGDRVSARVEVAFTRIAEAEFGSSKDAGTHFMRRAANAVARRLR